MKAKVQTLEKASSAHRTDEEIERFRTYLRGEKRTEATEQLYVRILTNFLKWFGRPVSELTPQDMLKWKQYLAISMKYCENSMSSMVAAINQYVSCILFKPELKLRPPKRVNKSKIPLTLEEVKRILEEARNPSDEETSDNSARMRSSQRSHAIISLMYFGGLRVGEIVNLRLSDLMLDSKKVRINAGKGKDYSIVNLTDYAVNAIKEYLKTDRIKPSSSKNDDFVFLTARGLQMDRSMIWLQIRRIAFRAGISKNVHPHIFRHSMITHMAEKGIPTHMIQAQSRHKSLDMVQHYTHLSQESVRNSYDVAMSEFASKSAETTEEHPKMKEPQTEQYPAFCGFLNPTVSISFN